MAGEAVRCESAGEGHQKLREVDGRHPFEELVRARRHLESKHALDSK